MVSDSVKLLRVTAGTGILYGVISLISVYLSFGPQIYKAGEAYGRMRVNNFRGRLLRLYFRVHERSLTV